MPKVKRSRWRRGGTPAVTVASGSLPLTLTTGTSPTSKTELDPVTGRPQLSVSVNLDLKMDIAGLVELLVNMAKVQDVPQESK